MKPSLIHLISKAHEILKTIYVVLKNKEWEEMLLLNMFSE